MLHPRWGEVMGTDENCKPVNKGGILSKEMEQADKIIPCKKMGQVKHGIDQ